MTYGYDPFRGVEQFYDGDVPSKEYTAPLTHWLRDTTKLDFVDISMPDGHVIRAITKDVAENYERQGGEILADLN